MTEERKAQLKKTLGVTVQIAALLIITLQYAKSFSSPATSAILSAFAPAGVDSLMVKNIESIPSLMAIVGSFAVGIMERYMRKKTMLWVAMICTLVGGVAAGFMPETVAGFYGILVCRVILGFGRGMIFPMASSFIADLFDGNRRDRLMSYKTAVGGLSGSVFQLIGGFLAVLSWRYAFIGYLFIIPIVLMIAVWLPEPDVKPAGTTAEGKKGNALKSLTPVAWLIIVLSFVLNFFQFSYFTNISLCVSSTGLGDAGLSGTIMSIETLASAAGAICYGAFLKGRFGGFDIAIAIIGEAIGFWILTSIITVPGYYIGSIIWGFAFGIFNPALILQTVKVLPKEGATLGLSLLSAFQNLGQYLSAYVLVFLAGTVGMAASNQLAGWVVSWPIMIVFAVVVIILVAIGKAKNPALVAGLREPKKSAGNDSDKQR